MKEVHHGEYAKPDVLVTTDWVEEHLDDAGVRLIEVDEDTSAYDKGHIPGAVALGLEHRPAHRCRDVTSRTRPGSRRCSRRRASGRTRRSCSTAATTTGSRPTPTGSSSCAGSTTSSCSNGGRKKWELESRELTQDVPGYEATGSRSGPGAARAARTARRGHRQGRRRHGFVDVRSPEEFRGEKLAPDHLPQEQSQVPGHIPGAANMPWAKAANDDGTFKSADELRRCTQARASPPTARSSPTAGSASGPATPGSCCTELLGYRTSSNYDGSWTEYGSLVGAPVEMGSRHTRRRG